MNCQVLIAEFDLAASIKIELFDLLMDEIKLS